MVQVLVAGVNIVSKAWNQDVQVWANLLAYSVDYRAKIVDDVLVIRSK